VEVLQIVLARAAYVNEPVLHRELGSSR
jgi:hypothetical protein